MPKTYTITQEQMKELEITRKENRDKRVEKRLHAVILRGNGKNNHQIAAQLEVSSDVVSRWVSSYVKDGLKALLARKTKGNRWNMSYEAEEALLRKYEDRAQKGMIIETSEIKQEYEKLAGHPIGSGQIYRVFQRHGWRKVKPRSRHPKKATEEVIEASKKLTGVLKK